MADEISGRPRDLLVSGHVNVDRFLTVDEFPAADRTVPVVLQRVELGGTGANLARVAARYGVATGLVARIGREFPADFLRRLRTAGIDLRGLEQVAIEATPTCFILEDRRGVQRTLIDQGPMGGGRGARVPGAWLDEYSWLHVTTGDPTFQLRLARAARAHGLRVAADPAQEIHYRWKRRQFAELLAASELFFGNRGEVARAVEYSGCSDPSGLLERVPLVVRTEGPRGATAFSRTETVHVPAERPRSKRSTVGAGDAFRGGFYAAWFEGEPLRKCLTAGVRASRRWIEDAT
ncbi:MAG: PfkB family carbohydrate kinase [Thermoplasmata archaeon]|jgi:sugar/nucleoside kinase (ribokinase family)